MHDLQGAAVEPEVVARRGEKCCVEVVHVGGVGGEVKGGELGQRVGVAGGWRGEAGLEFECAGGRGGVGGGCGCGCWKGRSASG